MVRRPPIVIMLILAPECVTEEQDEREKDKTGDNRKEPEDGAILGEAGSGLVSVVSPFVY